MKPKKVGNDFIEHIPYIKTVIFSDGSFFDGYKTTTVCFHEDQTIYTVRSSLCDLYSMPQGGMAKAKFLSKIQSLHIENWDREYEDDTVMDGEQWSVSIHFTDGYKPLEIYGSNAYPPHFKDLQKLMTIKTKK